MKLGFICGSEMHLEPGDQNLHVTFYVFLNFLKVNRTDPRPTLGSLQKLLPTWPPLLLLSCRLSPNPLLKYLIIIYTSSMRTNYTWIYKYKFYIEFILEDMHSHESITPFCHFLLSITYQDLGCTFWSVGPWNDLALWSYTWFTLLVLTRNIGWRIEEADHHLFIPWFLQCPLYLKK